MIIDERSEAPEWLSWRYKVRHVDTAIALGAGRPWNGGDPPPRPGLGGERGPSHAFQLRNQGVSRQIGAGPETQRALSPLADELGKLMVQEFASRSALRQAS